MKEMEILDQYDIDIKSTRKIRGAILCEANQGMFLLKEINFSEKRIPALYDLYQHIQESGYPNVDAIVKNKNEEYWCVSEGESKYVLKKWFLGKECDNKREWDVLEGVRNLARLHEIMKGFLVEESCQKRGLKEELEGHNRELRKVRSFIRKRTGKNEFESSFLKAYESMYEWAESAFLKLSDEKFKMLDSACEKEGWVVHGDYNYHNVLMTNCGVATTSFEHYHRGMPIADFYYFLRKTMEKNHWNIRLGAKMLEEYNRMKTLTDIERECLAACIAYPEKFWKVANTYYRSRKSWISAKSVEKLETAILQTEEKKEFLRVLFSFSL